MSAPAPVPRRTPPPGDSAAPTPRAAAPAPPGDPAAPVPRRVSRRAALRAGGAALAATALSPAAAARAATDEGGLLLGLWRREMGASLAYDRVAHVDPVLVTLRGHEADHAAAIATQLAAVGLATPRPPRWAGQLDASAERLARSTADDALDNARLLEEELVGVYRMALAGLPDAKIAMTAATILASHSQHLLILGRVT